MKVLKSLAKDWLPPIVVKHLPRSRRKEIFFEGPFPDWQSAAEKTTGYDAEDILQKVLKSTIAVKRGEAAFERDSVLFQQAEYEWPVFAGLLWGAATDAGRLDVLDFGGALGSSYFQHAKILGSLTNYTWSVVEQRHFVRAGRQFVQDDCLRFYNSIAELLLERKPNVVLVSSVLQYIEEPRKAIEELTSTGAEVIVLDRTFVNSSAEDKIYIQHVPETIYLAQYPCRSFSEDGLVAMFHAQYQLHCSFSSPHSPRLNGINSTLKGFLFNKLRK